ncbi:hypothetical protein OCL06_15910 [Alteromonas sp. ASW11-19]|uniref:Uncharacterized protein n=1 Tax=Alteromonas salexigens TaxID=2982530 RepID=A0ABT2VRY8_9ALTE|nr:hypothetical protein [Alteromonas salexigens]MCU7556077.1 hypothetical protein [Alteromonas salexigens]
MLIIDDYPELKSVFWDWNDKEVDEKTAFEIIEKRWPYIDPENLTHNEKELINKLAKDYGHDLLLVA